MRKLTYPTLLGGLLVLLSACPGPQSQNQEPEAKPLDPVVMYDYDLWGAQIQPSGDEVKFTVFAPSAESVVLKRPSTADQALSRDPRGVWSVVVPIASPVGQRYRFVVDGHQAADPYGFAWSWEDYSNGGWSLIVDPKDFTWTDASWNIPSIDTLIIYELHIKDFTSDANDTGNGAIGNGANTSPTELVSETKAGTYGGLIQAIPYLTELGVNAVELMPISEFNDGGYSWGYNTSSFFAPESGFSEGRTGGYPNGSQVQEFQSLVDALHTAGMAVIVDMVYNHVGNDQNAFWAIDKNYYFDYNENGTLMGSDAEDSTPWGNRFATGRPVVKKLMYDNMRYFIEDLHVDGFRFDATSFMNHTGLIEVVRELKKDHPQVIFTAEQLPNASSFKGTGIAQWGGLYHDKMKALLRQGDFEGENGTSVDNLARMTYYDRDGGTALSPLERVNYFESHDENSVLFEVTNFDNALKGTKLGALNLFTAMGTPMLMQGQEFLRSRKGQDINEVNGQIDWGWQTSEEANGVERQGLFDYYKGLIALRKAHPALRLATQDPAAVGVFKWSVVPAAWGDQGYPATHQGTLLLGYSLNANGSLTDQKFVVVLNFGATEVTDLEATFPQDGDWKLIADDTQVVDAGIGTDLAVTGGVGTITIPARSGVIYRK